MILTVTPNAALDVTYEVEALERGGSHRVRAVRERAGGKGINVARVADALGCDVLATGLLGGVVGDLIRDDLDRSGLAHDFATISGTSRRTLTIVETESGEATVLNEAGPQITAEEWQAFLDHFGALVASASVVVLSGSLPPGVPADAYAQLARRAAGRPVILDADGVALMKGVPGRPAVIKPNADELLRATAPPAASPTAKPPTPTAEPATGLGVRLGDKLTDQPTGQPMNHPAGQVPDQLVGQVGDQPTEQIAGQVVGSAPGQSVGPGASEPVAGAADAPVGRTADGVAGRLDRESGGSPVGSAAGAGARGKAVVRGGLGGVERADLAEVVGRAKALRADGAENVLVSLGADGMLAVTAQGIWWAAPPGAVVGNPTGAGDAAVAATARALTLGRPWDELLRDAVALSAAAVAAPVAGDFDPDLYVRLLPEITIEGLSCPS